MTLEINLFVTIMLIQLALVVCMGIGIMVLEGAMDATAFIMLCIIAIIWIAPVATLYTFTS